MKIDFDFACRDDCLDQMVPSDLRILVAERDRLKDEIGQFLALLAGAKECLMDMRNDLYLRGNTTDASAYFMAILKPKIEAALSPNAPGHGAGDKETPNGQ